MFCCLVWCAFFMHFTQWHNKIPRLPPPLTDRYAMVNTTSILSGNWRIHLKRQVQHRRRPYRMINCSTVLFFPVCFRFPGVQHDDRSNVRMSLCWFLVTSLVVTSLALAQEQSSPHTINLPTSKTLPAPSPGRIGSTNSFPETMVVSPDGRYAAMLNDGYGTQETLARQSIAVLDLQTNRLADFPDARFDENARQSFFIGLAFSSDGKHLYASVGSITDPTGTDKGDLGNGIAVYSFSAGKVAPERFIAIAPQPLPENKKVAVGLEKTPPHTAIPYPAGLAVIADGGHDKLLVADNLSDNVVLLDAATGKILRSFDLSTNDLVPTSFPYTCVATRDGRRAWCSLWNASQVAELDLGSGKVARWIDLDKPSDPLAPGSHPTAMVLSRNERALYVALSNVDAVAVLSTEGVSAEVSFTTKVDRPGSYPTALAVSKDGGLLFVANSSMNAVAVLNSRVMHAGEGPQSRGFITTDW
jgi:hypothetical protein